MSRYIDADALKPDYYDEYVVGDDEYVVRYYSETQIDKAPSIDIVRCKECKWASSNKEGDYDCKCHIPIFRVDAEGYCYLADRKESE